MSELENSHDELKDCIKSIIKKKNTNKIELKVCYHTDYKNMEHLEIYEIKKINIDKEM